MTDYILEGPEGESFVLSGPTEDVSRETEAEAAQSARDIAAQRTIRATAPGERQEGPITDWLVSRGEAFKEQAGQMGREFREDPGGFWASMVGPGNLGAGMPLIGITRAGRGPLGKPTIRELESLHDNPADRAAYYQQLRDNNVITEEEFQVLSARARAQPGPAPLQQPVAAEPSVPGFPAGSPAAAWRERLADRVTEELQRRGVDPDRPLHEQIERVMEDQRLSTLTEGGNVQSMTNQVEAGQIVDLVAERLERGARDPASAKQKELFPGQDFDVLRDLPPADAEYMEQQQQWLHDLQNDPAWGLAKEEGTEVKGAVPKEGGAVPPEGETGWNEYFRDVKAEEAGRRRQETGRAEPGIGGGPLRMAPTQGLRAITAWMNDAMGANHGTNRWIRVPEAGAYGAGLYVRMRARSGNDPLTIEIANTQLDVNRSPSETISVYIPHFEAEARRLGIGRVRVENIPNNRLLEWLRARGYREEPRPSRDWEPSAYIDLNPDAVRASQHGDARLAAREALSRPPFQGLPPSTQPAEPQIIPPATGFMRARNSMTQRMFRENIAPFMSEEEFADRYFAGMYNPSITFYMETRDEMSWAGPLKVRGEVVGTISRGIDPVAKTAINHALELHEDWQGKDLAKMLLREQVLIYQQIGIERIHVHAGLSGGGYTWARFAFEPTPSDWSYLASSMQSRLRTVAGQLPPELVRDVTALFHSRDPRTLWVIAQINTPIDKTKAGGQVFGTTLGKHLLRSRSWDGNLNLNDAQQMQVFWDYVNTRKGDRP